MEKVTRYQTNDGKEFETELEAYNHEKKVREGRIEGYRKFLNTNSCLQLRKVWGLDSYGTWEVRGEDTNVYFGGYHNEPHLFTAEGVLKDIIEKAVVFPGFWTWGAGGSIKRINIEKIGKAQ